MNVSISDLSHLFIQNLTDGSGIYIDATAGNGYDTLFIAKMLKQDGALYSFDISDKAVFYTKRLLCDNDLELDNIKIIHDSHENIDEHIADKKIKAAMFNLGYLPNSDKNTATKAKSTICALENILNMLTDKGVVTICSYVGHDGGEEDRTVSSYLLSLDKKAYEISRTEMINRVGAPVLYLIIKKETMQNV